MQIFDPHVHMTSRTTDDYEAMSRAGISVVVEPAFWLGQPRTHVGTFEDYFLSLVGWERFRASQFGIRHYCTIGLNPKEANNPRVAPGVMQILPAYLEKDGVVAVGETGFDDGTEAEERYFEQQVRLAMEHGLPVLVHTPHRDKKAGTIRSIELLRSVGIPMERVLIDHNNEETIGVVLESGAWAGHSIYPNTKMDEHRMVALVKRHGTQRIIVNSAADWGISDVLKVPKTVAAMRDAGIAESDIEQIVWRNPLQFFAQSGRLDMAGAQDALGIDQRNLFEGNSVLRGQQPLVDVPAGAR
jgi:predicted metal-dependent TIM-barrel fold hydrolase